MHRNVRRVLLALGITLIVLPAAISDAHCSPRTRRRSPTTLAKYPVG